MSMQSRPFTPFSRTLHWTMAGLILIMLFIGICMVASPTRYHTLVSIHRPLGILTLALVAIRLVNRLLNPPPLLPEGMPAWQCFAAVGSHVLLYFLMVAVPLTGWASCLRPKIHSCSMARCSCPRSCRSILSYFRRCVRPTRCRHFCCSRYSWVI